MKRVILTTVILFATMVITMAQSWQKFNYQGVARDAMGEVIDNQAIGVRISIHSGTMAGPVEFQETHMVTTNDFGLFDLAIGGGTVVSGDLTTIPWGGDNFFVQVEMDPAGGTSYADMGTSQLLSTPYAQYAKEAGDAPSSISGDANYLVKFTGSDVGGNSNVYESALGYIGIGTDAPGRHLQVSNDAASTTYLQVNNLTTGLTGGDGMSIGVEADGGAHLWQWENNYLKIGTNNNEKMRIAADGKVGIGTISPAASLHVEATGSEMVRLSGSAGSKWLGIYTGNSREGILWSSGNNISLQNDNATGLIQFNTDGYNPRMTIDELGNVGINTTAPAQMLHVVQTAANKGIRTQHQSATDYWETGVGTTTDNYKFYFNNLFRADISSVDGAYTQSSDMRLKHDLNYLDAVLPNLLQLKAASYHYIDSKEGAPLSIGFVAQEVEPLFPDLVREGDDGFKGITYDGFAVLAIKAIQEQQELIEQLQAEVELLKNQ